MMSSTDGNGEGKGRNYYNDDNSSISPKGKSKMRSMKGMGKGGMHSGKSMGDMNHYGKGMSKMNHNHKYYYYYSGNGKGSSDNGTTHNDGNGSSDNDTTSTTTGSITWSRYQNGWNIITGWIERRRSHYLWRGMA
jgi:hypothetical protein